MPRLEGLRTVLENVNDPLEPGLPNGEVGMGVAVDDEAAVAAAVNVD